MHRAASAARRRFAAPLGLGAAAAAAAALTLAREPRAAAPWEVAHCDGGAAGVARRDTLTRVHSHAARDLQDKIVALSERLGAHLSAADRAEEASVYARALERMDRRDPGAARRRKHKVDAEGHRVRLAPPGGAGGGGSSPEYMRSWADASGRITIVEGTVRAPLKEVATAVWHSGAAREQWDPRVERSQAIELPELELDADQLRTVYLRQRGAAGWRGWWLRDRDFCFTLARTPAGVLGRGTKESFATDLYVLVDAEDAIAPEPGVCRAKVNGLLVLRPIAAGTLTQVVLVLEMEPHGWHGALNAVGLGYPKHRAAEEDLSTLKAFVEDVMDDAMNAKDEMAAGEAMKRLTGEVKDVQSASLVNAVGAYVSKDELKALRDTLKARRKQIAADEAKLGIKLTDLKKQVDRDIRTVERRLRTHTE